MGLMLRYRRYLHRMRMNARVRDDGELESAWRAKQEEQPGTPLPSSFPFLDVLAAAGYTMQEDLDGADKYELQHIALMNGQDADVVLTALQALPPLTEP